jgi:hypothetical protein
MCTLNPLPQAPQPADDKLTTDERKVLECLKAQGQQKFIKLAEVLRMPYGDLSNALYGLTEVHKLATQSNRHLELALFAAVSS